MIKILHFADLHLGSDFLSLGSKSNLRKDDLKLTFLKIIKLCNDKKIDILLAVGDIFDSWNISEDYITFVRDAFASLQNTKIIIVAGNHDPLTVESAYLRSDFWSSNVTIIPEDFTSVVFDDIKTEISGASFGSAYQHSSLLKNVEPQQPSYIQICAIHGTIGYTSIESEYNPIAISQIASSNFDYLALGHIHKTSTMQKEGSTYYAYPGCPEGRGFDELGEKGVFWGEIDKGYNNIELLSTASRMYLEVTVNIADCQTPSQAADKITDQLMQSFPLNYNDNIYKIHLEGSTEEGFAIDNIKPLISDLYYAKIIDKTTVALDLDAVSKEISLRGVFTQKMLAKLAEDASEMNNEALQLGLKAFTGKVDYSEN